MAKVAYLNISTVYLLTGILLLNELGYLFIKEKRNVITVYAASYGFVNSTKSRNLCSIRCKYVVPCFTEATMANIRSKGRKYYISLANICGATFMSNMYAASSTQCFPTCGPRTPGGPRVIQKGSAG
jgi:hypothetical protein